MTVRITAIVGTTILAVALVGCSNSQPDASFSPAQTEPATSSAPSEPSPSASAERAAPTGDCIAREEIWTAAPHGNGSLLVSGCVFGVETPDLAMSYVVDDYTDTWSLDSKTGYLTTKAERPASVRVEISTFISFDEQLEGIREGAQSVKKPTEVKVTDIGRDKHGRRYFIFTSSNSWAFPQWQITREIPEAIMYCGIRAGSSDYPKHLVDQAADFCLSVRDVKLTEIT